MRIRIVIQDLSLEAELVETACAKAVAAVLPVESWPNEWGDEFYFEVPVITPLDETATLNVKAGDIGYWPPGRALAVFFGPTPASSGTDPVPASSVNIVGRIKGDPSVLKSVKGASRIRIEKA
jgi:hypothetical protein